MSSRQQQHPEHKVLWPCGRTRRPATGAARRSLAATVSLRVHATSRSLASGSQVDPSGSACSHLTSTTAMYTQGKRTRKGGKVTRSGKGNKKPRRQGGVGVIKSWCSTVAYTNVLKYCLPQLPA
eukprot:359821-Chlamydomonas_euryale.AAC.4